MKRITISIILLFVLVAAAIPAGATPIVIPALDNNNASNAEPFNPNTQFTVTGVESATTEASESEHTCAQPAAGPGTKSVWFRTQILSTGTLTLDTTGSSYTTAGGPSSNTVISLYRLDDFSFNDFSDLISVSCSENGAGVGIINAFNITQTGDYYIQVSASPVITVTGSSSVTLTATVAYTTPFGFDEPEDARALKVPSLPSVVNIQNATRSLDELDDPVLDQYILDNSPAFDNYLTNTVWFKFTATSPRIFALQNFYDGSATLWFSLYEKSGAVYTPANTVSMQASPDMMIVLVNPGTYYLRVGLIGEGDGTTTAFITFTAIAYFVPHAFDFSVPGTEGVAGATIDLTGWSIKNADPGETAVCEGAPGSYDCYFQLISSGAAENTSLKAKIDLTDVKVKKGDVLTMQAAVSGAIGTPNFTVKLTLKDAAGVKQKYSLDVTNADQDFLQFVVQVQSSIKPVLATLQIKNKDTVSGNSVKIDSAVAAALRVGEGVLRNGTFKLPLSGDIPAAWSTGSGPKGVLPVPAAPSAQ